MATNSGHQSFSSLKGCYLDDSSEISGPFDLQDSLDQLVSSAVRATVDVGNAQRLSAEHRTSTNPDLPVPPITATSLSKSGIVARDTKKFNYARKGSTPCKVYASTKVNGLGKATPLKKNRCYVKVHRLALPISRPTSLAMSRDEHHGQDIELMLRSARLEPRLVQHFKTVANMMEHMNYTLFHSELERGIERSIMGEVKGVSEELIYFFDGLQRSLRIQLQKIWNTKNYLPILGDNIADHHLEAAIKVWAEKICQYEIKPRKTEQYLLNKFAAVYDANVYSPFLQLRRRNARYHIRELSVHLDSVYNAIEGTVELYEQIIAQMAELGNSLRGALEDFCRLPGAWFDRWAYEKALATADALVLEPLTPSGPSTPAASTDPESDGGGLLSKVNPVLAKVVAKGSRVASLKRESTL